jgi:type II secretory pathway pseudopilin PulG
MYCEKCANRLQDDAKFCGKCGTVVTKGNSPENTPPITYTIKEKEEAIIKCGNCDYIGAGELARSTIGKILAWLCILFAPIITIIYFVATHKYRCPKCKSTFLGIKNKDGKFVGQKKGGALSILVYVLIGVAVIGVLSSVVLASLNTAREKAKNASSQTSQISSWQTFNSVQDQFSASFPVYPTTDSKNYTTTGGMGYKYDSYTVDQGDTVFVVSRYIYSDSIDISDKDSLLERFMNQFVNGSGSTLVTSNYGYYNSYRLLDFNAKNDSGNYVGRIILVGETPYILVYGYTASTYSYSDYQKFINSFEIK